MTTYLWPGGTNGYRYAFSANALGTRFARSTVSSTFAPDFTVAARIRGEYYVVTMHIPFAVLRIDGHGAWRVQFGRTVVKTRSDFEWAHSKRQTAVDDVLRAGYFTDVVSSTSKAHRAVARTNVPAPSVQVDGVARLGTLAAGGVASRLGATANVPITQGTALLGTIDPDGSGIETYQNLIAPTVFPLPVSEVRPFFAQTGALFLNPVECILCPETILDTTTIPSPHDAFGVVGKEGTFAFSGFSDNGIARHDDAQIVSYHNDARSLSATAIRTAAQLPGATTGAVLTGVSAVNLRSNLFAYATYGEAYGTVVTDRSRATYGEVGAGIREPQTFAGIVLRQIGRDFIAPAGSTVVPTLSGSGSVPQPVARGGGSVSTPVAARNGSVPIVISGLSGSASATDIAGFGINVNKQYNFSPNGRILNVTLAGTLERYRNAAHARNIATTVAQIGATTHGNVSVSFSSGSQYLRVPDGRFRPFDQQGIGIGYLDGTATPVDAFYSAGRYADGFLRSWVRRAVVKPTTRSSLIAEFDDQRYRPDGSGVRTQYLQRVAYEEQFPGDSSAVIGIFRTAGIAPPTLGTTTLATTGGDALNLDTRTTTAAAATKCMRRSVNPSLLATSPQMLLKYIYYFGPVRGT